ncbi:MAG: hypothetical protein MHMPM18_000680 [Marteilia pararefringens]
MGQKRDTTISAKSETNDWLTQLMSKSYMRSQVLQVNKEYIEDRFNLVELPTSTSTSSMIHALEIIKGNKNSSSSDEGDMMNEYDNICTEIYGLIHARFIITPHGIKMMDEKIYNQAYGQCQRLYCRGENLMPIGLSNFPGEHHMNLYCPKCNQIMRPFSSKHSKIDGSFFGRNFPQMYFMMYPRKRPKLNLNKWKINDYSDLDTCCCDGTIVPPRHSFRLVLHKISFDNLIFDPMSYPDIQSWLIQLPGNKILIHIPSTFIRENQPKLLPRILSMTPDDIAAKKLLNILAGSLVMKSPITIDKTNFECLLLIYGMFHTKYTATDAGILKIKDIWTSGNFGTCMRQDCKMISPNLFPISLCPRYNHYAVKYYCFSCQHAYHNNITKTRNILDGAYYDYKLLYNTIIQYPAILPNKRPSDYIPKLFEVRIHPEVFTYEEDDDSCPTAVNA